MQQPKAARPPNPDPAPSHSGPPRQHRQHQGSHSPHTAKSETADSANQANSLTIEWTTDL